LPGWSDGPRARRGGPVWRHGAAASPVLPGQLRAGRKTISKA
jgi:hypothetical protein